MTKIYKILFLITFVIFTSCSSDNKKVSIIEESDLELQMIDAYKEGYEELEKGDVIYAAKKFNEAELLYPQSIWAPRSALMTAYSYYNGSYYLDAINELKRFLEIYPNHERISYAYYLLAMSYYEQISDEKKDLGSILDAKLNFEFVLNNYPNSDFALDSEYKLELIQEILASKEMYLAKYYIEREKWIPAINRFKNILENYDTTIYVEEAIHRLVEIHYKIGLIDESKKYASVLGYNYLSNEWYKETYKIYNKDYSDPMLKVKKNKKSLLKKFKSLF